MSTNEVVAAPPFSFEELTQALKDNPEEDMGPIMVPATDGIQLAVRKYSPPGNQRPKALLIFYHGGGAHSNAGYNFLGRGLAQEYNITVYTPDLRGHGLSEGSRGDSPTIEQIYIDIDTMVSYVLEQQDKENNPIPFFIGGHSSGGGVLLNYFTWIAQQENNRNHFTNYPNFKGCVMVSPQLGHLANVNRPKRPGIPDFAQVNVLAFIVNGIFGILGHNKAVQFTYPKEILEEDPLLVSFNTITMANAITPTAPKEQFQSFPTTIPLQLWIGQEDELFDAQKVIEYANDDCPSGNGTIVEKENHLSILIQAHAFLGPWILEHL